ncbi:hypothetical protein VTL71DRAFT_12474 [Oculimacula yallundae]|uniref:Heterokaryon incompatibility domain-containing protein n=1 Tax=Oculimacula yallundae TaxID=86028 RepID=A0ABR4CQB2_9HELO
MTSVPRYRYSTLDERSQEVRILILLPGVVDDPIHILLQTTSFTDDNIPDYEALSYAWGSTDNPKSIQVGDEVSDLTTLEVTSNLAQALPYLRHLTEPRTLWIDAICVNQQDLVERGSQVKRMPDLFSKAKSVVVWLGPETPDSALALNMLQRIGSTIHVDWLRSTYVAEDTALLDEDRRVTCTAAEILSIAGILSRSWFERLWIVQEICLAPPSTLVQCGATSVSWNQFAKGIFLTRNNKQTLHGMMLEEEQALRVRLEAIYDFVRLKYSLNFGFSSLSESTKNQKCSDPRDRIFAVLSLAKDLSLEPDYTKNANETFKDFVLMYLRSRRDLNIILSVGCNLDSHEGPSWVLDWSNIPPSNQIMENLASGESEPLYRHDGDTLTVQGIVVGTIGRREPFSLPASYERSYPWIVSETRRIVLRILGPASADLVSRQDLTSIAKTIIPNALAGSAYPNIPDLPNLEETRNYLAILLRNEDPSEGLHDEHIPRLERVLDYIYYYCYDRALYRTEEGHFGIGPHNIQPGDQVAVLLGCKLLAALRPSDHGTWQVVGETYVDGFVHGESILGQLPDSVRVVRRYDGGISSWAYLDGRTGALDIEDPRLGPLPRPWTRKKHSEDDRWTWYVNTETGEERRGAPDPRLDYDELLKRHVPLREFVLV